MKTFKQCYMAQKKETVCRYIVWRCEPSTHSVFCDGDEDIAWLKQAVRVCEIIVRNIVGFRIFRRVFFGEFMVTNWMWLFYGVRGHTYILSPQRRWFITDYELNIKQQSTSFHLLIPLCLDTKRHINHAIPTFLLANEYFLRCLNPTDHRRRFTFLPFYFFAFHLSPFIVSRHFLLKKHTMHGLVSKENVNEWQDHEGAENSAYCYNTCWLQVFKLETIKW